MNLRKKQFTSSRVVFDQIFSLSSVDFTLKFIKKVVVMVYSTATENIPEGCVGA